MGADWRHFAAGIWWLVAPVALFLALTAGCMAGSLEDMRVQAARITSISGHFVQEKQMPILVRPLIAKGFFAYQRPASLRWEYIEPIKSVLLMHAGQVHRYRYTDKGWIEERVGGMQSMDFILQEISSWLSGRFEDNPMFAATVTTDGKIVMTPKDAGMETFIRRIELTMAQKAGVMKSVTVFESEDSFTRFTFVDPRINEPIPAQRFQKVQ